MLWHGIISVWKFWLLVWNLAFNYETYGASSAWDLCGMHSGINNTWCSEKVYPVSVEDVNDCLSWLCNHGCTNNFVDVQPMAWYLKT